MDLIGISLFWELVIIQFGKPEHYGTGNNIYRNGVARGEHWAVIKVDNLLAECALDRNRGPVGHIDPSIRQTRE